MAIVRSSSGGITSAVNLDHLPDGSGRVAMTRVERDTLAALNAGEAVYRRGVNTSGGEFASAAATLPGTYSVDYGYDSLASFQALAARGHTLIRLPFRWERVQPTRDAALDTTELGRLTTTVANIATAGMQCILDVHNYARYINSTANGGATLVLGNTLPASSLIDLWTRLSTALSGNPGIYAYGLMNEPHDITATSGLTAAQTWESVSQQLVDAIRANSDTTKILIPGYNWSGAQVWATTHPTPWITDPAGNHVYEAHYYFDVDNSGDYPDTYTTENAAAVSNGYASLAARVTAELGVFTTWLAAHGVRGLLGECGWPNNADDQLWNAVGETIYDLLDAHDVDATYWAAGARWGATYKLSAYTGSPQSTVKPQATVLEAHPSRYTATQTQLVDHDTRLVAIETAPDPVADGSVDIQTFTSSGTWTKPAGATTVKVLCIGGGGGGGSGARRASGTASSGGAGGGGAGFTVTEFAASIAGATETVTVGTGGAGSTARTTNDSNGTAGTTGGDSAFGTLVRAIGGAGGAGGTTTGASSSGASGAGTRDGAAGGGGNLGAAGSSGNRGVQGGGGGAGGGGVSATPAFFAGATGGVSVQLGATGGGTAGTTDGAAGGGGSSVAAGIVAGGASGGGGAGSITGAAGAGGAAGNYGAGGGGGGSSLNGSNSGAGGAGSNGLVVVVTR